MRKKFKLLPLLFVSLVAAGCSTVGVKTYPFYDRQALHQGQTFVVKPYDNKKDPLEFSLYKSYVEAKLINQGFTPAKNGQKAYYTVLLDYNSTKSGEKTATDFYSGTYTLSSVSSKVNIFEKTLTMYFMHDNRQVYKSTAATTDQPNALSEVMPCLVKAMFDNFPGDNGRSGYNSYVYSKCSK